MCATHVITPCTDTLSLSTTHLDHPLMVHTHAHYPTHT
jgi:hypothetical protein